MTEKDVNWTLVTHFYYFQYSFSFFLVESSILPFNHLLLKPLETKEHDETLFRLETHLHRCEVLRQDFQGSRITWSASVSLSNAMDTLSNQMGK